MNMIAKNAEFETAADEALLASLIDEIVETPEPDDLLLAIEPDDSLLAIEPEIEAAAPAETDILLEPEATVIADEDHAAIEAVVAQLEAAGQLQALYDEQPAATDTVSEADKPATDEAALEAASEPAAPEVAKKGKKGKAKEPKAAKEPKVAKEPKEPKVKKEPAFTSIGKKRSEVLAHRVGGKIDEALILEVDDAMLEPEALHAKQADLMKILDTRPDQSKPGTGDSTQKKVAEKITMLFGWLKNGGELNRVMDITFRTLIADGEIVSGEKGNLHAALLKKPYSLGTCRAQAGQMLQMLPMLKIVTRAEKDKLVANPNSLILMKVRAEFGL